MFFHSNLSIVDFARTRGKVRSRMKSEYVRFAVRSVSMERRTGICKLLLASRHAPQILSVEVPPHQAAEIIVRANGMAPETEELVELIFRAHSYRPRFVLVGGSGMHHYHAQLHYRERARRFRLDLTTVLAVPFAARVGIPVYVHRDVIATWADESGAVEVSHDILPLPITA